MKRLPYYTLGLAATSLSLFGYSAFRGREVNDSIRNLEKIPVESRTREQETFRAEAYKHDHVNDILLIMGLSIAAYGIKIHKNHYKKQASELEKRNQI